MKQGDKFINEKGIIIEIINEKDKLGQVLYKIGALFGCTTEESLYKCFKINNYRKIN